MGIGIEQGPAPSTLPETGGKRQAGQGIRRWILLASAGLLALAVGHLAYHYILFTELGFRLLGHGDSTRILGSP